MTHFFILCKGNHLHVLDVKIHMYHAYDHLSNSFVKLHSSQVDVDLFLKTYSILSNHYSRQTALRRVFERLGFPSTLPL